MDDTDQKPLPSPARLPYSTYERHFRPKSIQRPIPAPDAAEAPPAPEASEPVVAICRFR